MSSGDGNRNDDKPSAACPSPAHASSDATSTTPTATNDAVGPDGTAGIDWSTLLPAGKVKAQVTKNKDIGKMSRKANTALAVSAALFLQKLVQRAVDSSIENDKNDDDDDNDHEKKKKKKNSPIVVRLDGVREAASTWSFIDLTTIESNDKLAKRPRASVSNAASNNNNNNSSSTSSSRRTSKRARNNELSNARKAVLPADIGRGAEAAVNDANASDAKFSAESLASASSPVMGTKVVEDCDEYD